MIKINIEVEDYDTCEKFSLPLPCNDRSKFDPSHNLQIEDWDTNFHVDFCDVDELNKIVEDINNACPSMTNELLSAILHASHKFINDNL